MKREFQTDLFYKYGTDSQNKRQQIRPIQRERREIISDIEKSDKLIEIYNKHINQNKCRIDRYTVELHNVDIEQHKIATMTQFKLWRDEFLRRCEDQNDYPTIKDMLSECTVINWDVGCRINDPYKTERSYHNSIQLKLGPNLILEMSANYSDVISIKSIIHFNGHATDIFKTISDSAFDTLSTELDLKSSSLQQIVGLCWHTFMFHPFTPHVHCSVNFCKWMSRALYFFGWRSYRLDRREVPISKPLNWSFLPLYHEEEEIDVMN
jgi:hypothetical protein